MQVPVRIALVVLHFPIRIGMKGGCSMCSGGKVRFAADATAAFVP